MISKKSILILLICVLQIPLKAQVKPPAPYGVLPTANQLRWHEMEMYVLVHFTPTTFEDKEWGYGDADPKIFNPMSFDANQIIRAVKSGGFKGLILVSKHHDGFCLWPTKTTDYNISRSSWRNGKGNMVKEMELACRKAGLKFGVYCSPWDRNNSKYGTPDYVNTYRNQLKELYSGFGSLFMSWHDGANGGDGYYGGAKEKRLIDRSVYYGWDTTWGITRKMQPGAVIFSDVGPDVRWVGNEKGEAAETSWATFTPIPVKGKTKIGPGEIEYDNSPGGDADGKFWMPAECDVPLRPGWFFHESENEKVKSPQQLFDIYLRSVGRGGCLDLGVAPDKRGLLHENDVASLEKFGQLISKSFANNLAAKAKLRGDNTRSKNAEKFGVNNLIDGDRYSYWATDDAVHGGEVVVEWPASIKFDLIRLRENIKLGQRIRKFELDAWKDNRWQKIQEATSVGSNRIIYFKDPVTTSKLRLRITDSPVCIALSELGVFKMAE